MKQNNLDKSIEKLIGLGLSVEDVMELIKHLQEEVSETMFMSIMDAFTEEELESIEKEFGSEIEYDEDKLTRLAELFTEKTGRSPVEKAQEILRAYLDLLAETFSRMKSMNEKFERADKEILSQLDEALKNKDWGRVKKALDEIGVREELG